MSGRKSFDYISDMKTLALIGVVLGHCLLFYAGNPYFPETADFTSKGAVWITTFTDASLISGFVFCSGFLFANSIKRRDRSIPEFLAGRSKRLIVTYYIYGALWLVPLFLYTDGVAEATNAGNKLFGTDRMLEALNKDPGASPRMLLANMKQAVDEFVGEAPQFDDLTMLAIKLK